MKAQLQERLDNTLCGIQRVPTVLLLDPEQALTQLHLEDYTVLDCERLHDPKGHCLHLLDELPYLFTGDDRTMLSDLIAANKDNTMTGAKCRLCMIELFLYLINHQVDKEILLVETAIRISKLPYLEDVDRNPRNILRLYNCTWIHHELCRNLITRLHGSMTYKKLFGLYLHALVVHALQQLEIISLRSVNTENQERIFKQARRSATAASNRHPNNILTTIILRLQAKSAFRTTTDAAQAANSIVAKAGKEVPKYKGTTLPTEFLIARIRSWQSHLKRISHYLLPGKGV